MFINQNYLLLLFQLVWAKIPVPTRPGGFFAVPGKILPPRAYFFASREF